MAKCSGPTALLWLTVDALTLKEETFFSTRILNHFEAHKKRHRKIFTMIGVDSQHAQKGLETHEMNNREKVLRSCNGEMISLDVRGETLASASL